MSDISFGPGPDGAITARLGPDARESAHRFLRQNGAVPGPQDGEYVFGGPDAVARAAQAAWLHQADSLNPPAPETSPTMPLAGVDVVFARHSEDGIVAATATDSTEGLVPEVLRQFGFRYDGSAPDRDIYLPPTGADERQALAAAARASVVLQGLGLQVATVGLATAPAGVDRLAEAAEDLAVETVNLRSLTDSRDVADVLDTALDPKVGALPNLLELIDSTQEFVARLPPEQSEVLGAQVSIARHQTTVLAENLSTVRSVLADTRAVVEAPIITTRSARATAASAVSALGLPAGPIIQAVPAARTLTAAPSTAATL
ncbi:hypothetical protein ACFVVA_12975 [Kitasatospora sp. NPDC058048]|uniref:hypothetical protein n=1 Tax=Kitasatospora sp. NPDC058048 TaxID=3346313 RepID=UPI0036DCC8BB